MRGAEDTFRVKIQNKHSAAWQGCITWVKDQQTQCFRSALEMIRLIDGTLEEEKEIEGGQP